MDRELIIRLAREAGLPYMYETGEVANIELVERFAALAYERGFVDGMSEQAKRSVDKAVNSMAEPKHEVKNLADYEFKTYKIGGFQLEAGFYSADELRDLIKAFDKMNAATERSMRRMK